MLTSLIPCAFNCRYFSCCPILQVFQQKHYHTIFVIIVIIMISLQIVSHLISCILTKRNTLLSASTISSEATASYQPSTSCLSAFYFGTYPYLLCDIITRVLPQNRAYNLPCSGRSSGTFSRNVSTVFFCCTWDSAFNVDIIMYTNSQITLIFTCFFATYYVLFVTKQVIKRLHWMSVCTITRTDWHKIESWKYVKWNYFNHLDMMMF